MNKKVRSTLVPVTVRHDDKPASDQIEKSISQIHSKIVSSAAMNGGFDALVFKVDRIEASQGKIETVQDFMSRQQQEVMSKVNEIHIAMYDPDKGIFARVANVKAINVDHIDNIDKEVLMLKLWKANEEKKTEKEITIATEVSNQVEKHDDDLKFIITWQKKIDSVFKWSLVTAGGGVAALVGKLLYDFFSGHIHIV